MLEHLVQKTRLGIHAKTAELSSPLRMEVFNSMRDVTMARFLQQAHGVVQ